MPKIIQKAEKIRAGIDLGVLSPYLETIIIIIIIIIIIFNTYIALFL